MYIISGVEVATKPKKEIKVDSPKRIRVRNFEKISELSLGLLNCLGLRFFGDYPFYGLLLTQILLLFFHENGISKSLENAIKKGGAIGFFLGTVYFGFMSFLHSEENIFWIFLRLFFLLMQLCLYLLCSKLCLEKKKRKKKR